MTLTKTSRRPNTTIRVVYKDNDVLRTDPLGLIGKAEDLEKANIVRRLKGKRESQWLFLPVPKHMSFYQPLALPKRRELESLLERWETTELKEKSN